MFTNLFNLTKKAVTVFSSSDKDAPTLTNDAGSLKTLLKACLVTGYGDKKSLGWQMPFESEDLNTAVFKSAEMESSGYCLRVNNGSSDVKLSVYQSMSDINTGVKPLISSERAYQVQACNWKLVGHGRAFVLLLDYQLSYYKTRVAYPLLFGDLPKQTKRIAPVCVFWNGKMGRDYYKTSGGVQSTLFHNTSGNNGDNPNIGNASSYGFLVNDGQGGDYLNKNYCRFTYGSDASASVLYEPVLCNLPDSTWTLLPMLQPLSTRLADVAHLGLITESTIKVVTGYYGNNDNLDCAVPIDWWYA